MQGISDSGCPTNPESEAATVLKTLPFPPSPNMHPPNSAEQGRCFMSSIDNVVKCKWQVNAAFLFQPFDRTLLIEDWGQTKGKGTAAKSQLSQPRCISVKKLFLSERKHPLHNKWHCRARCSSIAAPLLWRQAERVELFSLEKALGKLIASST